MYIYEGAFATRLPDEFKDILNNKTYQNKKIIEFVMCPPNRAILITDTFEKIYYNF